MNYSIELNAVLRSAPLLFALWAYPASAAEHGHDHAGHATASASGDGQAKRHGTGKAIPWTQYPTLKIMMSGEGMARKEVTLLPRNIAPASVEAYASDLNAPNAHRQLPYDLVVAKLERSASGGFYWLSAREESAERVTVATTVYYLSERGSKNPTTMFMQQKNALEIIPQPFPREHSRYRSNEDWRFLVRFNSQPLTQQKVSLVTQNGSKQELVSDAQGVVTVHLPDDFKAGAAQQEAGGHSHGRKSSDFVLAVEHADAGKTYLTGFNSSYGPDAYDQRSLAMGLGFMLLGMVGAVPLLRQRKAGKKAAGQKSGEEI